MLCPASPLPSSPARSKTPRETSSRSWGDALSRLYLIRHAQASFGAEDYDVLSELGREQAAAVGRHLAGRKARLDAIYTGPRRRHRDTVRHLLGAGREAGAYLPKPIEAAELDEYPAFELFRRWLPALRQEEPELAAAAEGGAARGLGRALERITARWASGELDAEHIESFHDFSERVDRGFDRIIAEQGRGVSVALVTSAGPIGLAVRRALELSPEKGMQLVWSISNTSITELAYRGRNELGLIRFNSLPHLAEDRLITNL